MKFPLCRQRDDADCGPACLATVAASFGKRHSIAELGQLANTGRRGTSLAGLVRAAEYIGFHARGVRAGLEAARSVPFPAIAHWNDNGRNHFVVVHEASEGAFTVGDPATGLGRMTEEEFRKKWTGVLLILVPKPDSESSSQYFRKAKPSMTSTSKPEA